MSMAHDPSQPWSSRLDDELHHAVRLALRGDDAEDADALRRSVLLVASEARARNILPEQLLVRLKEAWSSLPEVRAMHDSHEQARLLQRVVRMCIHEYYNA
jgi:hypothetical protein